MQGVTTALAAFVLVCVAFPKMVRNRAQFYVAAGAVVAILALDAAAHIVTAGGTAPNALGTLLYVFAAAMQVVGFVALMLSAGGFDLQTLADDITDTYREAKAETAGKTVFVRSKEEAAAEARAAAVAAAENAVPPVPPGGQDAASASPIAPGKLQPDKSSAIPLEEPPPAGG